MPRFHPLEVTDVRKTIRDAVVVTLRPVESGDFRFTQGQYLTFRRDFDGTEIRRSYSICSGVQENTLQVGIKRVADGAFSSWANDTLAPGMVLEAMEPMGAFHTALDPDSARQYLGFAGGSGITPILSIIKTTLDAEPNARFTLVYANRGVHTIMFREELEDLKNRYMGRFSVIHVLESDAQEIELFHGRVDEAKCAALFEHWIDVSAVDVAFICGPEPMMLGIAAALRAHGLTDAQIKFELFASGQPGRLPKRATAQNAGEAKPTRLDVIIDGARRTIETTRDSSILQAAIDASLDPPFSCTAGVCSTCKCKVLEGEVEMVANHALEDYEVAQGYRLSCQSYPMSARVVVDYDLH
ncbi:2Fe-2S iron-sulfur cluster-binding protein [Cognatishimia sp. F0-27]|uniref:2Fe-2S iron-sulfur cluster-binding protein n=1 Tax=Cognatishimia sp. F0-27 TaxID=2816855 RepID=UPI001D0C9C39|nr:2Fe-2S iron-sulfur cluster-binding protein [Cognatishimia sp. F0-27]MCC1492609.1 2Fe-2S iron-sulfur cluster binding domain-containing protein [Cognatishimia sp. F0-27]